jgi:hypothetical protein
MKTRTVTALPIVLVAAVTTLMPTAALAQQQPIYGCRQSINCRPSPTSNSALNDPGVSGLLVGTSIKWGPGFHMGPVMPALKMPLIGQEPTYDVKDFHLRNASLLPTPEPAAAGPAAPVPTVTPSPH